MSQLQAMKQETFDWNLTGEINEIASTPVPWLTKLEKIAEAILSTFKSDGAWILTLSPLPTAAVGIVKTHPPDSDDASVVLTDSAPPIAQQSTANTSVLSQVLQNGSPKFGVDLLNGSAGIDEDLGDAFLRYFDIDIQAIVPISLGKTPGGIIALGGYKTSDLSSSQTLSESITLPQKQDMLKYVGQHLFLTLQNAKLVETANHQARQLATLNRIARAITSSLDLDEVLQRAIIGIDEILDVEAGAILLADENNQELYFKILLRGIERIKTDFRLKSDEGIAGWVYQNRKPTLINDVTKDPRFSTRIDEKTGFKTRSVLCTPLIVQGTSIGVLEVLNKRRGGFILDDLHLLTSMTASLAIALKNSTLFQHAQQQITHMAQISNISIDINTNVSISATIQSIVGELQKVLDFQYAVFGLLDETKHTIQHTMLNQSGEVIDHLSPISLSESFLRRTLSSNNTCQKLDITELEDTVEFGPFNGLGIRTLVTVILTTENNQFGVFALGSLDASGFSQENVSQLSQVSPALSSALEKARLMDAMERRTNEMEELNLLSERLLTNAAPGFILDTALNFIPRLLPAAVHGLIVLDRGSTTTGLRLPENAPEVLIDIVVQDMRECLQNSLKSDQVIQISETRTTFENPKVPKEWRPQSKLLWPVLTLRGSLGVVYLAYPENTGVTADHIRLFSLVVSRLSGALENSRLFIEVEQERAKLAAILSSTVDGILVIDQHGRVLLDNPAANQIMSHTISQRNQLLTDITDNRDVLGFFDRAKKSGSAAGEFTTLDDKTYYTIVSPVKVTTNIDKASIIGWIAVMQDVTHFKELNETKDSFVNAVSHDLRSPLSGIALATQLLEMTSDLNDRQQDFVRTIHDHVSAMTKLIDALLDVGKIEAGIDMKMEHRPVKPIVIEAIESLKPQAAQKALDLSVNLETIDSYVKCNSLRLQQVFSNLISNAIKYTPDSGSITVNLSQQDDFLLFQVIDTGTGIPQADQAHIFEKFYRVRGEHMTGIKGSGLGLAITKSIVEKHNGKIWVDSRFKGGGSTFSVLLPVMNRISSPEVDKLAK